jgi:hypothetical protein
MHQSSRTKLTQTLWPFRGWNRSSNRAWQGGVPFMNSFRVRLETIRREQASPRPLARPALGLLHKLFPYCSRPAVRMSPVFGRKGRPCVQGEPLDADYQPSRRTKTNACTSIPYGNGQRAVTYCQECSLLRQLVAITKRNRDSRIICAMHLQTAKLTLTFNL